jgi:hypothetical protein
MTAAAARLFPFPLCSGAAHVSLCGWIQQLAQIFFFLE